MLREHDEIYPEIESVSNNFEIINTNIDLNNLNKKTVISIECQQPV